MTQDEDRMGSITDGDHNDSVDTNGEGIDFDIRHRDGICCGVGKGN